MDATHPVAKPRDCTDPMAWDRYYASRIRHGFRHRSFRCQSNSQIPLDEIGEIFDSFFSVPFSVPEVVDGFKSRGWTSIWVPGCGLSPLPKLLAHLGLTVTATDISEAAVAFQQSALNDVSVFSDVWKAGLGDGRLFCELHDLRTDYEKEAFDAIINVQAFQGFPGAERGLVAKSHFRSLKAGRDGYFYTLNTRNMMKAIEQDLADAGFAVISPNSQGARSGLVERDADRARNDRGARIAIIHLSSG
jgi:hypothetical protein